MAPIPLTSRVLDLDRVAIRHELADTATPSGVSFHVALGEVVLLLGPSGSGKSTLTLAMNGLIPHDIPATVEGHIIAGGLDTGDHRVSTLSTAVSMVFQDPDAQVVTATVMDEVCFGPENLQVPVDEVLARAERALRRMSLWEVRDHDPDTLSGGGRQRLAIACALAMEAPVMVLDEPTANLDPVGIEEVYAALREVVTDGDKAIVLVEHDLDAAIDLVDRVVVLDRSGQLCAVGTVDEIIRARSDDLEQLGVWMPLATIAARQLRTAGVKVDPLPVTLDELRAGLDAQNTLPALPARRAPAVSAEPVLTVTNLSVRRGRGATRRTVLRDVDLTVPNGAFLAIVGVNGAGKSTLLRAIAGVNRPPRNRVALAGLDPATASARRLSRTVGFVFQNPEHQFIRHTVEDELAHGLQIQHRPDDEIRARVDEMLERLRLTSHRHAHPFALSGGQKRRLSVGTALITGPEVLALDEPTFGQDRETADELLRLLADLNAHGTTVIVVTHDMQLMADYASHVTVLADGRVTESGPVAEVLAGDALVHAGLRLPPLARTMRSLTHHESWRSVTRLADLPGSSG